MHHPEKAYHVPATVLVDALIGALGFFFCGGALASALALVDPSFVPGTASQRLLGHATIGLALALCSIGALRWAISGR